MYIVLKQIDEKEVLPESKISQFNKNVVDNNLIIALSNTFGFDDEKLTANANFINTITKKGSTKIFVFRFSEYACSSCVEFALNELKNLKPHVKDSDILIISSFSKNRDYYILKKKIKEKYSFINEFNDIQIIGELKSIVAPHFFILDNEAKIKYFYMYQDNIKVLNEKYFDVIKTKFKHR